MIHTDSALILQHDESHHIGIIQDQIQEAIDCSDCDKAEEKRFLLTEYLLLKNKPFRHGDREVRYRSPYSSKSNAQVSLRECAV